MQEVCSSGTLFSGMFVPTPCFSMESIEIYTSAYDPVDLPEKVNEVSAPRTPVR